MVTGHKARSREGEPCCDCSCPCEGIINLVGKKWTLCVLAQLGNNGIMRFNQLAATLPGISAKTLADVLKDLNKAGLIGREAFAEIPPRVEYHLTSDGRELTMLVAPLMDWADRKMGIMQIEN
ncbi:MAG TPA: helix-turn-helix domain-containing protein [Candidatus Binatus sp.]|nr:helix-turn-helix domain-containing protein [Candidatus Binatus sp.]